ncbi:hypothetical protein [Halobaculum sp. EA56]|uniref:hypothetical protein n=1 Tax=Halobaculum sp. EA56 TaxID=3421648 RepID=UPI003EB6E2E0
MTGSEPERSVRRGVAVLLVPLSLLLLQVQVVTGNLAGVVESPLPGISRAVGVVLLVAAGLYLVVSVGRQVAAAADTPF